MNLQQRHNMKSALKIPVDLALYYAEKVASNLVADALEEPLDGNMLESEDPIFHMFKAKLYAMLNDMASADDVSSFVHATECLSYTDVVQWAESAGVLEFFV